MLRSAQPSQNIDILGLAVLLSTVLYWDIWYNMKYCSLLHTQQVHKCESSHTQYIPDKCKPM